MNFQEVEKTYKELQAQHGSGKLNDAAFETEVGKLRMQDEQGRWWQIGVQTGEWYMHDGQKWNKAKPPAPSAPAPAPTPVAPVVTPMVEPASAKAAPAPKPVAAKKEPAPKPDPKQPRASALPRVFSAKPGGRDGGLSRPVLIGIIAAVAVIILLVIGIGYFVATNVLGTASKPTTTPTRALAVLPTQPVPSRPPTVVPTNTPVLPPTPVVTETAVLTTTVPTRAPAGPTATKKAVASPTVAAPKGSPTLNVPLGVYAMKLETDPPKLSTDASVRVGFKLTMFNNTGSVQTYHNWFVRVFQCPEQCQDFKNSYGESLKADVNVGTGTVVVTAAPHVNFGPGRCEYTAVPYYTDANSQAVQFQKTTGGGLYYSFNICQ
jgi:hypothetical protein